MAESRIKGNVRIEGNLTIVGQTINQEVSQITAQDPLLGLGTPSPGAGYSGGLVIEKNVLDINNIDLTGNLIEASPTSITISQTGFAIDYFKGWYVKFVSGTGAGQQSFILSSVDNVLTTNYWGSALDDSSVYNLSKETHAVMVYQPSSDRFFMGASSSDSKQNSIIESSPKDLLVKRILQSNKESIYYVGKHGNDNNNGGTIAECFLTFTKALSIAPIGSLIKCFDNGVYNETVNFDQINLEATNATIFDITISQASFHLFSATTINTSVSNGFIKTFTNLICQFSGIDFISGDNIVINGGSSISGNYLSGSPGITLNGGNGDAFIEVGYLAGNQTVNVSDGTVYLSSEFIQNTSLAETNLNGILRVFAEDITNTSFTGTGSVYFTTPQRVQDHILNTSNPHNVTINQISPLTTKGDLLGFSTTSQRFPSGSNGKLLSSNSTQPFGLEWVSPPPPSFQNFTIAQGSFSTTPLLTTIGVFAWNSSQFSNLTNGNLLFYNENSVNVSFEGTSTTYASFSYSSSGYQVLPITLPSSDDLIKFKVSGTQSSFIYNVVLTFGIISSSFSASTAFDVKSVSANYTILTTDDHIICTSSSGTLTLPPVFKKKYVVFKSSTNIGTLNVVPNGLDTINGGSSIIITNLTAKTIFSDGVSWFCF